MAAPQGNQNAKKAKVWSDAIRKVLAQDKKRIERMAKALLDAAEAGDLQALKEFGDRMEGKPTQAIEASGPGGGPIPVETSTRPQLTKEEWLAAHGMGTTAGTTD